MTGAIAQIWRYPIKALGREPVTRTTLAANQTLPGDRQWAVAHTRALLSDSGWSACRNFLRAAKIPALMAIEAISDEDGAITLSHPDRPNIRFHPETEASVLFDWLAPLLSGGEFSPATIVRATSQGMTDSDFASISLINLASNAALAQEMAIPLSPHRWRGNIWIDGAEPWQEFDWVGHRLRIGSAELEVRERITRCRATESNPDTGIRDANTLSALQSGHDHQNFGVYCVVVQPSDICVGDNIEVIK